MKNAREKFLLAYDAMALNEAFEARFRRGQRSVFCYPCLSNQHLLPRRRTVTPVPRPLALLAIVVMVALPGIPMTYFFDSVDHPRFVHCVLAGAARWGNAFVPRVGGELIGTYTEFKAVPIRHELPLSHSRLTTEDPVTPAATGNDSLETAEKTLHSSLCRTRNSRIDLQQSL
ncbi:hypothetical protein V8E54_010549 [Elaphomyces granulatus]